MLEREDTQPESKNYHDVLALVNGTQSAAQTKSVSKKLTMEAGTRVSFSLPEQPTRARSTAKIAQERSLLEAYFDNRDEMLVRLKELKQYSQAVEEKIPLMRCKTTDDSVQFKLYLKMYYAPIFS